MDIAPETDQLLETEHGFVMLLEQESADRQFVVIRYVRMMLRDPAGVNTIIRADTYPAEPYPGTAYFIDNCYQVWNTRKKAWETLTPCLSDGYILEVLRRNGRARGIIALIDFIITRSHKKPRNNL
jgi:hypothetical protein